MIGSELNQTRTLSEILEGRLALAGMTGVLEPEHQHQLHRAQTRFLIASQSCLSEVQSALLLCQASSKWIGIGVRDFRLVSTLLEIVISWGIYPFLRKGVGIPIEKRLRSSVQALKGMMACLQAKLRSLPPYP